jgi:CheY-like chemotaxis protein
MNLILLIDDAPDDQELIERALSSLGGDLKIQILNDGLEAIAYMMGEGKFADRALYPYPTFIITDLKMPGADGFAVLEHIKGNPAWAVIPTLVLSSSEDPDDIRTAYLLGASSYQVKAMTYKALVAQMKILHAYWMNCRVPEVDDSGMQVRTVSQGKMGERFPQPFATKQRRVA